MSQLLRSRVRPREPDEAARLCQLPQLCLQDDGIVAKLLVPAGTKDIPVGTLMAILVEEEEHVAAFKDYQAGQSQGESKPEEDSPSSSSSSGATTALME